MWWNNSAGFKKMDWMGKELFIWEIKKGLLLSGRPAENRSVFGLTLCSARSTAIRMSSSQRSISDTQLDGNREKKSTSEWNDETNSIPSVTLHMNKWIRVTWSHSFTIVYVHEWEFYLAATTTDWRCPRSVNEWGTPHSSSLSLICKITRTLSWNHYWLEKPVTTLSWWSHTVMPYRGNWPWTLNWLDGVNPRLVYTKESLN